MDHNKTTTLAQRGAAVALLSIPSALAQDQASFSRPMVLSDEVPGRANLGPKVVPLVASLGNYEFETQLRVDDLVSEIYGVAMCESTSGQDALFTKGSLVNVPATLGTIYCLGDGTSSPCPCDNESPTHTGGGCANSTGEGGRLLASGSSSITADDLTLSLSGLPGNTLALLFVATDYGGSGATGIAHGDGLACFGGTYVRSTLFTCDANGEASHSGGYGASLGILAGSTLHLQTIYRDVASPCGVGFNLTNALSIEFGL